VIDGEWREHVIDGEEKERVMVSDCGGEEKEHEIYGD